MSWRSALFLVAAAALGLGGSDAAQNASREAASVPVTPAQARRISAIWGGSAAYVPGWAPRGLRLTNWSAGSCACGTDDTRLTLYFTRAASRFDWVVTRPTEIGRLAAGIGCEGPYRHSVINGRRVFYRDDRRWDTAWMCIRVNASLGKPGGALGTLTISVRQYPGGSGVVTAADLRRMVVSAHPSPAGLATRSRYELPSRNDVQRMARSLGSPLLVPTVLPNGFIFSQWRVSNGRERGDPDKRRTVAISFGRNSLYGRVYWRAAAGTDSLGIRCPRGSKDEAAALIKGRRIYANKGIHGVSVWTCIPEGAIGNDRPLEIDMWYEIRLHSRHMLRLAMRMVGTARIIRPTA
jgi:hypothetical protein